MPLLRPSSEPGCAGCVQQFRLDLSGQPELSGFRLCFRFDAEPDAGTLAHLTASERERMAKFRYVEDRVRFAGTRAALRTLLGSILSLAPERVPIELGPNGKPILAEDLGLHFNVSHSGNEGLLALSRGGAVGVDVERKRPDIDFRSVAGRVFAPAELEEFRGLDDTAARERFYRGWTYKEAVLKALALGIAWDTRCFAVLERKDLAVSAEAGALPVPPERLVVAALPAPDGYAAAIARIV